MKNIIIFGANSAIAKECVNLWSGKNNFYLIVRDKTKFDKFAAKLKIKNHGFVKIIEADLSNFNLHSQIWTQIINDKDIKKIDVLFLAQGKLENQITIQDNFNLIHENIKINVLSVISIITLATKTFEKQREGTIAVISSIAGDKGRSSNYIYGSSKAMLSCFLSGLRQRFSKSNVNILTIKPGIINTPMTKDLKKSFLSTSPKNAAKLIVKSIDKKKNVIYVPFFWFFIILIIKLIPEKIFKKLSF